MAIDFSKLVSSADRALVEPRDIFMALPNKDKKYDYPRDVQTEVWKQWFDRRNEKNLVIKMNTGSGKTTVGLTILQSCLNEGKGPALYVVPDNYLVSQVCSEAKKLGIRVSYDEFNATGVCIKKGEEDYFFTNKQAILVTNVHKLVNGKSIFGLRSNGGNIQIGSIIIDDVHACMNIIAQQYTVQIDSSSLVYSQIIKIFSQHKELKSNSQAFYNITENKDLNSCELIPFWIWQKNCEKIRRLLLDAAVSDNNIKEITLFNLPLLADSWQTCNCVLTANNIEITPKGIPISKITSFEQAERRIFMSATLSDDSVFVSTMGLKEKDISGIITPEKANDIGERLILFPRHLNALIDDDDIKKELTKIALKNNVVVIVPSFERLSYWQDLSGQVPIQTLSSYHKNIESGIQLLKQGKFKGLTILVNKYDGVDLPEDACRFLVIDGLPTMRSEYDIAIHNINPDDQRICRELIQKVEQGMGRGVRSNNDYCVVVLMGSKLANILVNQDGSKFFSKATSEQYNISQQLWRQLMSTNSAPTIEEVFELADYVLKRDSNWISTSKNMLASVKYEKTANIDCTVVATRKAFEKAYIGQYDDAFSILESEKNQNTALNDRAKGLLMQQMAEYKNFSNPAKAQELLISGLKLNPSILKPIDGIRYNKRNSFSGKQGASIIKFINDNFNDLNDFVIYVDSVLDDLIFAENTADSFESAIKKVASIIGIHSSRPEKEGATGGPDNLWVIDNLEYFIIECKNGVKPGITEISKSDCAQLLSSIQWFENLYAGNSYNCHPIIIHRVAKLDNHASPDPRMRVMTAELLEKFKTAIRSFTRGIASDQKMMVNSAELQKLLILHKLDGAAIIKSYTTIVK